jgi:alpha-beta hydrolase superfamily lysophospholipase
MDGRIKTPAGVARPLYFHTAAGMVFGWLHLPETPGRAGLGVVICNPFGYESICAHRSVREFAEAFAGAGIPALRFDYIGTGDSGDVDENIDHVELWSEDIMAAARELKALAGVERICLLGIRLGALLATLAAENSTFDSMILIGPVVSGRRYVSELRMTQRASDALNGSLELSAKTGTRRAGPQPVEAGGFTLSASSVESLMQVDLSSVLPAVNSLLILDADKLPSAKRWADRLATSPIRVDYRSVPGLIEMSMTAPQFAVVPHAMISACIGWLTEPARAGAGDFHALDQWSRGDAATSLEILVGEQSDRRSRLTPISERPVSIPAAGISLFGIVSEPRREEKRRRAVILLNPGADCHIGASRMYVSLARRWARRGYFALRVDLGGIGDSETRTGKRNDEVFPDEAIDDIRRTIEYMRTRYGTTDITVAGLCSGAYHALRAAAAGLELNRILMVNPQNYFWKKGMTLEQIQLAEVVHNPGLYRRRMFSVQAWTRIIKGEADITRIAGIYLQRVRLAAEAVLRDAARRMRVPLPNDLGWELERIVANGVGVTFLFARGEPGIDLLKLQAGSTLARLEDQCHVRIVDSGDHIFSRREPRALMGNLLSQELFASVR